MPVPLRGKESSSSQAAAQGVVGPGRGAGSSFPDVHPWAGFSPLEASVSHLQGRPGHEEGDACVTPDTDCLVDALLGKLLLSSHLGLLTLWT